MLPDSPKRGKRDAERGVVGSGSGDGVFNTVASWYSMSEMTSAPSSAAPMTVSQLSALVKSAIESALPATLHVVGEISNFKRHASGHLYFTLKDAGSEISCVVWRSDAARIKFEPKDGTEVIASGSVEVFERAGRYQLYVRRLDPRGVGALELAFRQLREKLEKQGFFDVSRKRALPRMPATIAVVTSPTGAAIADILRTLERRFPCVRVLVFPVRVQGDGAAAEIARAIQDANSQAAALGGIDVMIVGRGGGSLEDLWAFNEEAVARAIFQSAIPVISAVGHEVDVTIADLVADVRAATPTAAAELAVPMLSDLLDDLATVAFRLHRRLRSSLELGAARLTGLLARACFWDALGIVRQPAQLLDETISACQLRLREAIRTAQRRVERGENLVARISPHASLLRGHAALATGVQRLGRGMERALSIRLRATEFVDHRLARSSPVARLARSREQAQAAAMQLETAATRRLETLEARLGSTQALLHAVSHERVLARGFSITRTKKGRRIVRSIGEVADGDRLVTQVADGEFESQALNNQQRELFDNP